MECVMSTPGGAFGERDLSGVDYVYLWVDGFHLKVRVAQETLCRLVMIGVRADGYRSRRPIGLPSASASTHTRASAAT